MQLIGQFSLEMGEVLELSAYYIGKLKTGQSLDFLTINNLYQSAFHGDALTDLSPAFQSVSSLH